MTRDDLAEAIFSALDLSEFDGITEMGPLTDAVARRWPVLGEHPAMTVDMVDPAALRAMHSEHSIAFADFYPIETADFSETEH